jgi:hypothetical protein
MSKLLIQQYLNPLATLKKVSGSTYEGVVREACYFSVERRLCHSAGTKSATAHLRSRANGKAPNPGAPKRNRYGTISSTTSVSTASASPYLSRL